MESTKGIGRETFCLRVKHFREQSWTKCRRNVSLSNAYIGAMPLKPNAMFGSLEGEESREEESCGEERRGK